MKNKRFGFTAMICPLLFYLSGCATIAYHHNKDLSTSPWPPAGQNSKTLTVGIAGGTSGNWNVAAFEQWRARVKRLYRESNLFKEVREGFVDADRRVEFEVDYDIDSNWGFSTLTVITLGVIPSSSKSRLSMITTIRERNGMVIGTVKKSSEYVTVIQTLMLFVLWMPSEDTMYVRTIDDLCRSTILEAHEKGFL